MAKRITLEPALEQEAALWTPEKDLEMAKMFERWARQLRVRAKIVFLDRRSPQRRSTLKFLRGPKAALN